MAEEITVEVRNCKILTVGGGSIVFQRSGSAETFFVRATPAEEQWAGGKLYHYVDLKIAIGPAR